MPQGIIFDMDGLMTDTEPLYWEVGRQIGREFGREISDDLLRRMMGHDRFTSGRMFLDETGISLPVEDLIARRDRMMLRQVEAGIQPMPGLLDLLNRFHGRVRMGVATSTVRMLVNAVLPALGLTHYFDAVTSGDEIARGKPEPDIYLLTMSKLGVRPEDCAVLEDAPAGALAGRRAGAFVIAVPSALTAGEDFSDIAHVRVENLTAAMPIVEDRLRSIG